MRSEELRGKTVLVTGATDGIGKATAHQLAQLGARVVVHGRSPERLRQAAEEIRSASGMVVETLQGDLSSLAQVRAMGGEILDRFPRLDVLVHNAGVFMKSRTLTVDGLESTFAVNHLAPFLLTHVVQDLLLKSSPARVVTVSSITHVHCTCDFDNLQGEKSYDGRYAYGLSKLANVLFTVELAHRLEGSGVTANCLHPGVVATKLLREGYGSMNAASTEQGAETSVFLASAPDVAGVTGKYFINRREAKPSPLASDAAVCARLWRISRELCGIPAA